MEIPKESSVVCPGCGEAYNSREQIARVLKNSGYCVNLTCLTDLADFPLEQYLSRPIGGGSPS